MNKSIINRKLIAITLIAFIIFYSISSIVNPAFVNATQSRVNYTGLNEANYPGYNILISELKTIYPNATFTILYTGLDWDQVIANEHLGHPNSPRNLISSSKEGAWVCSSCGTKPYDNGSWYCASEYAISYYMDPRNWLNSTYVFQFEEVKFIEGTHTLEGIKSMTSGTFLAGDSIANAILTACKNADLSPYYVVARIKQEQGSKGSSTVKGNYAGYEGYYNIFNINASGNGSTTIASNALSYAKSQGWDTLEKSIIGGIDFLKSKYVNRGQNTLYLNKFDVDSSDGTLYSHQYMQNLQASYSESYSVYKVYDNTEKRTSGAFNFVIPVYENMPGTTAVEPSDSEITPINVKTIGTNIYVRSGTSTSSSKITKVAEKGTVLLSIERTAYINGHYWDKVVLSDGTIGYMASEYLEEIDTVQTCSLQAVVNGSGINVRNGPGTTNTSVITNLAKGTLVTIIDKECYNVDGLTWDKIILADGRQGFVSSNYLDLATDTTVSKAETVKINGTGVRLRAEPGTSSAEILKFNNGTILTRIEKGTQEINGHYWDKVTTSDGVIGYVATDYLVLVETNTVEPTPEPQPTPDTTPDNSITQTENYKIDITSKIITTVPDAKISEIAGATGEKIATGSKIIIDGVEYTVVKLGDVNGDGEVDARDSARILKHSVGSYQFGENELKAADPSGDGAIDARDSARILKYSVGEYKIAL